MMVVGGCVGSTGGGIKVLRVAILNKLFQREVYRLRVPGNAITTVVVDGQAIDLDEIQRVASLFFAWVMLLVFKGMVTEFLSEHSDYAAYSGMFSTLGNLGPCYIPLEDLGRLHPIIKLVYIFGMLAANKHDVVAIDKDRETCESLYTETGAVVLHGSATDIRTLEKAGAREADAMACLIRNDADNIAAAIRARSLGVPLIIALLRKPDFDQAYRSAGIDHSISATDLLSHQIMVEIEHPTVKKITSIGGGKAEIYAVEIPPEAASVGMTIREITSQKNPRGLRLRRTGFTTSDHGCGQGAGRFESAATSRGCEHVREACNAAPSR
jgi:Trk K+ transport system NAD-binding subunit